jgi:predicted dehydrogenase
MKRRKFLKTTSTGLAAIGAAPLILKGSGWQGANDRVNIAVIGIRGQGAIHVNEYQQLKNVSVIALCDVDENLFPSRIKTCYTEKGLKEPVTYVDLRKMLENKDIDAVSVVTTNHWHALASIWSLQAGKHVSVEKPCCHTFFEGQKLVEASGKYKKIVQDGAEQRSNPCAQTAMKYLREGKLGEVYLAKGICYKWRDSIGRYPDGYMQGGDKFALTINSNIYEPDYTAEYMKKVNYDLWLGPAPARPFNRNRFHYNWHWFWDYGCGDMGNQGVHEMDVARWGLGVKLPTKISAMGGHVMFDDAQETPNTLKAVFEFPDPEGKGDKKKFLEFETRHWMSDPVGNHLGSGGYKNYSYMTSGDNVIGNIFYGSKGYMLKDANHWQVYMGKERTKAESGEGMGNHYQNFVDAIRADDQKMLTSPIEEGFYSCALIHLANISYRLGRTINFDPEKMHAVNDPEANRMLTKEYRKPFVIPEKL